MSNCLEVIADRVLRGAAPAAVAAAIAVAAFAVPAGAQTGPQEMRLVDNWDAGERLWAEVTVSCQRTSSVRPNTTRFWVGRGNGAVNPVLAWRCPLGDIYVVSTVVSRASGGATHSCGMTGVHTDQPTRTPQLTFRSWGLRVSPPGEPDRITCSLDVAYR